MLLDRFFPPDIRVEKEARSLLKAGHEVFLLSASKCDMPNEETVEGIKVIRKKLPPNFPRRAWNFFHLQVFFIHPFWKKALEDAVKQYEIQIIHVHDLPLVSTGLSIARKFDLPLIADLHENYPEAVRQFRMRAKPAQRILNLASPIWRWKQMEKFCVQGAYRVITVVEEARQHYFTDCGIPAEKVTVVMNTEDLNYFYSLTIEEDIVKKYQLYFAISYIGGFGWHRGIQTAISAMPQILSTIPEARFIVVGSGNNEIELKELTRREGVEQAVEFTGRQPFALVPSYISASEVCLIPHIASGHTDSTIPHKIFQCMAMGKPVVVSSAKPLERIVKETGAGLVYSSGDAEALAEAVIKIYRDNELATKLGEAGKKAVAQKYNWEAEAKKLISLYQGLHTTIK
jgi:glycosyltransferase involved in cell wall biosynthesis